MFVLKYTELVQSLFVFDCMFGILVIGNFFNYIKYKILKGCCFYSYS